MERVQTMICASLAAEAVSEFKRVDVDDERFVRRRQGTCTAKRASLDVLAAAIHSAALMEGGP